jgi:hypothetical protein
MAPQYRETVVVVIEYLVPKKDYAVKCVLYVRREVKEFAVKCVRLRFKPYFALV